MGFLSREIKKKVSILMSLVILFGQIGITSAMGDTAVSKSGNNSLTTTIPIATDSNAGPVVEDGMVGETVQKSSMSNSLKKKGINPCDVSFNITLVPMNDTITPKVTLKNGDDELPADERDPYLYHIPVEGDASIEYWVEAAGYQTVSATIDLMETQAGQTVTVPVTLSVQKKIEEVRDQDWDTEGTELEISTAEQMAQYSYLVNHDIVDFSGKMIRLTDDIDLSDILWEPIGDIHSVGHFDGQNHTITINILSTTLMNGGRNPGIGVFGLIAQSVLENIRIEGKIKIDGYVKGGFGGGLVTYMLEDTIVRNCHVSVDVRLEGISGFWFGGIVGYLNGTGGSKVSLCTYEGELSVEKAGSGLYLGGIAGIVEKKGTVERCESSGVIAVEDGGAYTSGIAGQCINGTLLGCRSSSYIYNGGKYGNVAGITVSSGNLGQEHMSFITNCYFDGRVFTESKKGTAICKKNGTESISNCAYFQGSGEQVDTEGIKMITSSMSEEEILAVLNGTDRPLWKYDGEPQLIRIPEVPTIITDLNDRESVWSGMGITLKVEARAEDGGMLLYQWQRDGQDIPGAVDPSYTINSVSEADGGNYCVVITNTNAMDEKSESITSTECMLEVMQFTTLAVSAGDYKGGWTADKVVFTISDGLLQNLDGYEYLVTADKQTPLNSDSRWTMCAGRGKDSVIIDQEMDGYIWFRARAFDGTAGDAEGPVHVQIDRTAPVISGLSVDADKVTYDGAEVTMTAADSASQIAGIYYLVLEGQETVPVTDAVKLGKAYMGSPAVLSGLKANTEYVIYAIAADHAGNWSQVETAVFTTAVKRSGGGSGSGSGSGSRSVSAVKLPGYWQSRSDGWYFVKTGGATCQSEWLLIGSEWYYFGEDGKMVTGWFFDPAYQAWFYLKADGAMAVDWFLDGDGKWYYLNPVSDGRKGAMCTDLWVGPYYLGNDGVWVLE